MAYGGIPYSELYKRYELNRKFDHPANVTEENSHFGEGTYPPDWNANRTDVPDAIGGRRQAILEYHDYKCARCRTPIEDSNGNDSDSSEPWNCHHYRPIYDGGKHELNNLVALCLPCHNLMHGDYDDLQGDYRDAPMYPHPDADSRVAIIREPVTEIERDNHIAALHRLEQHSHLGENQFASSETTIDTSPGDAIRAGRGLEQLLEEMGIGFEGIPFVVEVHDDGLQVVGVKVEVSVSDADGQLSYSESSGSCGRAIFELPKPGVINVRASQGQDSTVTVEQTIDEEGGFTLVNIARKKSKQVAPTTDSTQIKSPAGNASPPLSSFVFERLPSAPLARLPTPLKLLLTPPVWILTFLATFLLPFVPVVIGGFLLKFLLDMWTVNPYAFSDEMLLLVSLACVFGVVVCVFAWFDINEYYDAKNGDTTHYNAE